MKLAKDASVSLQESDVLSREGRAYRAERWLSVIDKIFDHVSLTPHATALTDGDLEWTYADLWRRSELVARRLASQGVAHGSVVGMHLPRCADAIASMLGIMSSGCVYLPLDPSYPSSRVSSTLDRAGAVAVISPASQVDVYGSQRAWIPPASQLIAESEYADSAAFAGRASIDPDDHAYIIFTSGSTGVPKGVQVTHGNIAVFVEWATKLLELNRFDSSATSSSLSFDPSLMEMLLPLTVGGTVHVVSHALELGHLTRPVSFVATTPTVINELLRAGQLPHLKWLTIGGEALAPDLADRFLSSGRVDRLVNCYGPTETTIAVTTSEITLPVPEVIPIGREAPGTEIAILDDDGHQVPVGELGEICVFGAQVSDGYVNNSTVTAERFPVGPDATGTPQRYYRTGDLGYRDEDGTIYFAGRADRQVKINGHRIELGEIDAILRSHPQVSEATTVVQNDDRAIGYVVPAAAGAEVDIRDLRSHLSNRLPRYMVPSGIIVLSEIPTTINGKLDVSALPAWTPGRSEGRALTADGLDDESARVVQIVTKVTGFSDQIRPSDDFMSELGGTSLDLVQVLGELERLSGRRIRINEALADTTVAGLARLLHEEKVPALADFAFNVDGDAPPAFFIHGYLGGMLMLRRLAELLLPSQPVYGLHVYGADAPPGETVTIQSLARDALSRIREIRPHGEFVLLGHSAGGVVAFEAARLLAEAGERKPRVLLLDIPRLQGTLEYHWGDLLMAERGTVPGRIARWAVSRLRRMVGLQAQRQNVTAQSDDLMAMNEKHSNFVDAAVKAYKAQVYFGDITVMSTRQGRSVAFGRRSLGWAAVTRGVIETFSLPGTHLTLLDPPHVSVVAEQVSKWLVSRAE